jgi:hypothetical protein
MADNTLIDALGNLQFSANDTGWGLGANAVAQSLPTLVNPYSSPLQNLGITLGGALISSLLGYQAKKEAFDLGLQTMKYADQMQALPSPEARTAFIEALPTDAVGSGVAGRLTSLASALGQQEALQKAVIGQEIAKQEALAKFQLGDLGTKLYERDIQKKIREYAALRAAQGGSGGGGKQEEDWYKSIPAQKRTAIAETEGRVSELRDLANQFRETGSNAIQLQAGSLVPGSKQDLAIAKMNSLVPTVARLMSEVGNLSEFDQAQMVKATLGGKTSGSESIAKRLDQLASAAERMAAESLKSFKIASQQGGDALLASLTTPKTTDTTPPPSTTVEPTAAERELMAAGWTRGPGGGWKAPIK